MEQALAPSPQLKDLLSQVGLLLVKWGQIEHRMRSVVGAARGLTAASRQGHALVQAWAAVALVSAAHDARRRGEIAEVTAALDDVRPLRNLMCHGLQAARAEPFEGRPAGLHCWLEDEETVVSWSDLDLAIRRLESVASLIR